MIKRGILGLLALALAIAFAIESAIALGVCYVARSFGHPWPFWPVFVALFLGTLVLRGIVSAERGAS
jgi:FtsH-binding integral membrane protein